MGTGVLTGVAEWRYPDGELAEVADVNVVIPACREITYTHKLCHDQYIAFNAGFSSGHSSHARPPHLKF